MKKKIYRLKEFILAKPPASPVTEIFSTEEDDAYLQINQKSFKQNFKMLIGHYQNSQNQLTLSK